MKHLSDWFIFESVGGFSVKNINKVYHFGTMNAELKSVHSYEGSGLSISLHPNEWMRITKTHGNIYTMYKKDGKFLDFYKLNKKQKASIIKWGVDNGYVLETDIYRIFITDEEGEEHYTDFDNKEVAEYESDGGRVKTIKGIKPSNKLSLETKQKSISIVSCFDMLVTVYIEHNTDLDGIWWSDRLDVSSFSAPRGVIFNTNISKWSII